MNFNIGDKVIPKQYKKEGTKIFVDKSKAMAVATLIDGELEELK